MDSAAALSGPARPPAAGGPATSLVVLLHGVGSDGFDLIELAPHWAAALPRTAFVAPHGPFPCDFAPYGRQWFSRGNRDPAQMLAGARTAASYLDAYIDEQLALHGLGADRLALVGFSQGTMMALHVGPRRAAAPAALVGYSGRLLGHQELAAEAVSRPPVLLVHGTEDDVVPMTETRAAEKTLRAAGFAVEAHLRPRIGHTIDQDGLRLGRAFLGNALRS